MTGSLYYSVAACVEQLTDKTTEGAALKWLNSHREELTSVEASLALKGIRQVQSEMAQELINFFELKFSGITGFAEEDSGEQKAIHEETVVEELKKELAKKDAELKKQKALNAVLAEMLLKKERENIMLLQEKRDAFRGEN
uniref:Uncharacterized protein n=1 Tax=Steinernema glaseri TaxID=37863 RepID=A0A1I7Z712_9BILA